MTTRQIRDLAWAIRSPGLVQGAEFPTDDWFAALPCPAVIDGDFPCPPNAHHFRLGTLFEQIWHYWLARQANFTVLAKNRQVRAGRSTIGEFDLLLRQHAVVSHWELAVKFYLGRDDTSDIDNWWGPNTTDRLAAKLHRLTSHQLALSRHPAARTLLAADGIAVDDVRAIVKGRLFHPARRFFAGDTSAPPAINPGHERGWWMTQEEFARSVNLAPHYVLLPKSLWLSAVSRGDDPTLSSHRDIVAHVTGNTAQQATHVACLDGDGELHRGFVVSDRWLERAVPVSGTRPVGPPT